MVDKNFCMSSYLMYRYVYDESKNFGLPRKNVDLSFSRTPIKTADELIDFLQAKVDDATKDGKAALALSGGIDSAILARLVSHGGGRRRILFAVLCPIEKFWTKHNAPRISRKYAG